MIPGPQESNEHLVFPVNVPRLTMLDEYRTDGGLKNKAECCLVTLIALLLFLVYIAVAYSGRSAVTVLSHLWGARRGDVSQRTGKRALCGVFPHAPSTA